LGVLALAGCHNLPPAPPSVSAPMVGLPPPGIVAPEINLRLRSPDMRLDLNWLDLDGFMPPGAKRVGPTQELAAELAPMRRTSFPTTELCPSPDNRFVLFHDGMKRPRKDIFHWLMLFKQGAGFPNAIFGTPLTFETSWCEDSSRFAVTHYVGRNSSEVFVVDTADLARKPIEVRPFVEEHFPAHLAPVPMFLKAYRWARDGRLVVRAIARAPQEPYELFGCEVAVAFDAAGGEPKTTFLRGYIKAQEVE
jgi:hypothetical protein